MRTTRNHAHRRRGFTLIEIIVTIAILGILAVMITPVFSGAYALVSGSGAKSATAHDGASVVEDMLANQTALPSPLLTAAIAIPGLTGGAAPTADKYQVDQEGSSGNVLYDFYIAWLTGGDGGQAGLTPTPTPTPLPQVEPTDGALDDSEIAVLVAELEGLTLTGADWTETNKYARVIPLDSKATVPANLLVWFSQTTPNRAADAVYYEYSKLETITVSDNNKNLYVQIFFAGVPARALQLNAAPSHSGSGGDPAISATYVNSTGSGGNKKYNYHVNTTLSYSNLEYYATQQGGTPTGWLAMPSNYLISGYYGQNNANKNYLAVRFKQSGSVLPSFPTVDLLK